PPSILSSGLCTQAAKVGRGAWCRTTRCGAIPLRAGSWAPEKGGGMARPCSTVALALLAGLVAGVTSDVCAETLRSQTNRLVGSANPYLLQHASNPVDWYPWGPEALGKARAENKLIFVSIGYSTCFWCHVAERTIYSDPAIAELMNASFINVKIDREER